MRTIRAIGGFLEKLEAEVENVTGTLARQSGVLRGWMLMPAA